MARHDEDAEVVIIERGGSMSTFLWGALIGAGLTLLYAPRAGEATRRELRANMRRLRDRANDTVTELQSDVHERVDGVRREVDDRLNAARRAYDHGRQAARDTREDLRRRAADTRAAVRDEFARTPNPQDTPGAQPSE